ncbi:MAG: hypothetical protein K8R46_00870 [Pirellulales bacterium]|nr:hypothetical protein [Pirellulales bacterium]
MAHRIHLVVACIGLAGVAWLGGCSHGPVPTFTVKGLVTIDGKPLDSGGAVLFEMVGSGKNRYMARGAIASDGRYSLNTFADGDGAPAGRYRVAVFAKQARLVEYFSPKPPIPPSYGSTETSGLGYEVKAVSNTINIELSSKVPAATSRQ